jgi:uncharacterized membrane protein YheB (UPF0754 family)
MLGPGAEYSISIFLDFHSRKHYLIGMNFSLHSLRFFIYPIAGSMLGFITNFIAIKLLFRPKRKFLGVQGLLPKRQSDIAARAGTIVNDHLVNSESIRTRIDREKLLAALDRFLDKNNQKVFGIPLSSFSFMRGTLKQVMASLLIDKDGYFNRRIIESFIDEGMVSGIVEQKINSFDIGLLEKLVKRASGPELNFIIFSGAILGFIIGLAEAFIGI